MSYFDDPQRAVDHQRETAHPNASTEPPDTEGDPPMFANMEELQVANREAGCYWFSDDTIEFFGTIIESEIIDGQYFITSEKPPHGPRMFTVRVASPEGYVNSASKFCEFATLEEAEAGIALIELAEAHEAIPGIRR